MMASFTLLAQEQGRNAYQVGQIVGYVFLGVLALAILWKIFPRSAGFRQAWSSFWFSAVDPGSLHALRIFAGLLFLAWLLPLAGHVEALFSYNGWLDRTGFLEMSRIPPEARQPIGWSLLHTVAHDPSLVRAFYWGTVGVIFLFILGLATRITSVLTWLLMVSFLAFAPVGAAEDDILILPAFYLMIGYVLLGQFSRKLPVLKRIVGTWDTFLLAPLFGKSERPARVPSYAANLAMRFFQVNFALVLVVSCLHKLQFGDWWSGVAYWYPMHPTFETTPAQIHSEAPNAATSLIIYSLVQYIALAWQLSFPVWAWRRSCRWLLIGGGLIACIGTAWVYQMPSMGLFYLVGCLAFVTIGEWRRLGTWLAHFRHREVREEAAIHTESRTPVAAH